MTVSCEIMLVEITRVSDKSAVRAMAERMFIPAVSIAFTFVSDSMEYHLEAGPTRRDTWAPRVRDPLMSRLMETASEVSCAISSWMPPLSFWKKTM